MDMSLETSKNNHSAAVGYMLIATICISLTPLWIAWSDGRNNPFFFNAVLRLDVAIVFGVYLWTFYRHFLLDSEIRSHLKQRVFSWLILFTFIGSFDFAAFAWASQFIDISIAAILFELWAIFIIFFMHWLYRHDNIYKKINITTIVLLIFGFIGVAFVIASQSGELTYATAESLGTFIFGVFLALTGAVVSAFAAFNFRWSTNLSNEIVAQSDAHDFQSLNVFAALFAYALSSVIAAPASFAIGAINGETFSFSSMIVVLGGAFAQGTGSILWRHSNLLSDSPSINAMAYGIPILSLLWLALFSFVGVARPDYLIIGAIAIVSANLLINFEAEVRFGFKALIMALWTFGAFVYLRDDLLNLMPFETWLWPGDTYPEALALSATVFILLLSFRVARMFERTHDEDNRILELFQSLDLLVRRNVIDRAVREHLIKLDDARTPAELQSAYHDAKLCFAEAVAAGPDARNLARLGAAETQLNIIVHSRQQGVELGELFALFIFGGSTICIGILSRPPMPGWIGFLVEVLAFLFSAVIVFLIINVWDLHRERADLILEKHEDSDDYGLIFRDARSRRFEQSMSVIIGLAITAAYAALLWQKWLP